jgi:hypothetical protein
MHTYEKERFYTLIYNNENSSEKPEWPENG